jgi:chemotaxis-related protein WspB
MLFLVFQLGKDRYALDTAQVLEVLPMVVHKQIPRAPKGIAGAFTYHGATVPLLDLSEMALGRSSKVLMSTRIIVVSYRAEDGQSHPLGLLAEGATETLLRRDEDFAEAGVAVDEAPYLGPVTSDAEGIIQRIEIQRLLPTEIRERLFRQPLEPA